MSGRFRKGFLELLIPSVCPACDAPRRPGEALLCASCARDVRRLDRLGEVCTALAYEGAGRTLLHRFKFDGRRDALAVLLPHLVARVARVRVDGIVGVPRHAARVRERGDDPVHVLARTLARATGLPHWRGALRRTRITPPQTGIAPRTRADNVAGSFSANRSLAGRRVLLLDDVTTTGATLAEAMHALRAAGPRAIVPLALAGTPPGRESPAAL